MDVELYSRTQVGTVSRQDDGFREQHVVERKSDGGGMITSTRSYIAASLNTNKCVVSVVFLAEEWRPNRY